MMRQKFTEEMKQRVFLCISTYFQYYGVMPSISQMCYQSGLEDEAAVGECICQYMQDRLKATA